MNNIIAVGEELYLLHRIISYKEGINIDALKGLWRCDSAFKKQDKLYVCRHIPEIEFEEIETHENQLCDTSSQREG